MVIQRDKLQEFVVCKKNHSLRRVSEVLHFSNLKHCIVTDDDLKPLGIVSLSDIVYKGVCTANKSLDVLTAEEIMTKNIEIINLESSPGELCTHLDSLKIRNLPVTENNKVIGMIDVWTLWDNLQEYKTNTDVVENFDKLNRRNVPTFGN